MFFKSKFALILEENAQLHIINDFKNEISNNKFPVKNVLESILANLYWQYFQQNRYKFYSRTKTSEKVDTVDFRTWDLETLFNEIHLHYQNSLQNGLMLQLEPLNNYNDILSLQTDSKIYRPTLFDFLSHNALAFYKTSETRITKPAYKFEIDNTHFLADAKTFSRVKIASKDTTSLQLSALKIYQELISFHLKDKSPFALANVNIERIKFIIQYATFSNKETVLLKTLNAERNQLKTHEVSGLYDFEIASIFQEQSTLTTEQFLPIQQNGRLLVRYKNIEKLQFKVFNISKKQLVEFTKIYRKDEQLKFIKKLDANETWETILRNENDYQVHTSEVLLPKLNNGNYIVFASLKNNEDIMGFSTIQVTNMAMVENETNTYKTFQIINRNNGAPISNANVELSYYNNRKTRTEQFTTDVNGEIKLEKTSNRYSNIAAKVTYENDIAYFGNYYTNRYYKPAKEKIQYKAFLFTDRSIYRPGQTLYFKGIAIETKDNKSEVLANENITITLHNVNGENVKQLELTTNEFGSVSGEFILPNSGLTGDYNIDVSSKTRLIYGAQWVSVEEYKRPKFETKFPPITETFKVNDSITIKGNALAYAGSNITDAKVVYRVQRKIQYPRWYYWYRPNTNSESQEITYGETITNNKGEFEITFKAQPDQSVDKSSLPIFKYEVTADVTDLNGETRNATTIVNVGYHALKIYKLKAPNTVLRTRPWAAPDYQDFSKDEFKKLFPHDAYNNESNPNNWEKDNLVFEKPFNTETSKTITLGKTKKWQSGLYTIILESKDKFGQRVKDEIKTTLFSDNDNTIADKQLFSITPNKTTYTAGENAIITLASAAHDVSVTIHVEKHKKIIRTEIIQLNNNKKTISIPITNEDLGGFTVLYSFAAFNSYNSGNLNIAVPYPKTDLDIETKTFRDKLQQGQDETWSFKIKGPKGEKASAELLASMYDASLDKFKPHTWNFNPIINKNYYSYNQSRANQSFGTQNFRVHNKKYFINYPQRIFDQINWFGLSINGNKQLQHQNYLRSVAKSKYYRDGKEFITTKGRRVCY